MSSWARMNNLRSRQLNPCDVLYWKSRGFPERPHDWQERVYGYEDKFGEGEEDESYYSEDDDYYEEDDDYDEDYDDYDEDDDDFEDDDAEYEEHVRRSNVNNPNNKAYWIARGSSKRPDPWRDKTLQKSRVQFV